MKSSNLFIIQFAGLKDEVHDFSFKINNQFFEENDFWVDITGDLSLNLRLDKRSNMLILDFDLKGDVTLPCDRCTAPLNLKIKVLEKLYVKFGEESFQETDDIIIVPENEYEIDISPYIFEFISLNLPMKRLHKEGKCDEEMVNTIEKYKRKEENDNDTDPRWAALKNIKNN